MNLIVIFISILIAFVGWKNAECKKCRYEAILFGIMFLQFINNGMLGIKILITFIVGEVLIKYISK